MYPLTIYHLLIVLSRCVKFTSKEQAQIKAIMQKQQLSITLEDYLKSIYALQEQTGKASTSALAKRLSIKPASVSEMIKKLSVQGFVLHEPYYGLTLTAAGKKRALKIIRKHRLWEMYLYKVLKFPLQDVHFEADKIEHVMSDVLKEKVDQALGCPQFDPHGHPIPSLDGKLPKQNAVGLAELTAHSRAKAVRLNDSNPELLKYIAELGIEPGLSILV